MVETFTTNGFVYTFTPDGDGCFLTIDGNGGVDGSIGIVARAGSTNLLTTERILITSANREPFLFRSIWIRNHTLDVLAVNGNLQSQLVGTLNLLGGFLGLVGDEQA